AEICASDPSGRAFGHDGKAWTQCNLGKHPFALEGNPPARHEAETLAKLEQEFLEPVHDRLLEIALGPCGLLFEPGNSSTIDLLPLLPGRRPLGLAGAGAKPLDSQR